MDPIESYWNGIFFFEKNGTSQPAFGFGPVLPIPFIFGCRNRRLEAFAFRVFGTVWRFQQLRGFQQKFEAKSEGKERRELGTWKLMKSVKN